MKDISALTWYAVYTNAQKEWLVDDLLRQQGFETLYLHFLYTIDHARRTRTVKKSLLTRYIFAGVTDGLTVYDINSTIGVSTVVYGMGDRPLDIPVAVIEELRDRGDERGLVWVPPEAARAPRKRFRRGEQVRITDGPLAGLFAVVALDSGPAVRVWLEMFGGKVEALLPPKGLKSGSPERGILRVPARQNRR